MWIAILSSIKLYLNLSSTISNEIDLSKSYYLLSIGIYKMLILRPVDTNDRLYLDNIFSEYSKLIEQSTIILKNSKKDLLTIDTRGSPEGSLESQDSFNILTDENDIWFLYFFLSLIKDHALCVQTHDVLLFQNK